MDTLVSALYHSGVGWLNDILETEVFVDSELEVYSAVPRTTRVNPVPPEERDAVVFPAAQARRAARRARGGGGGGDDDDDDDDEDDEGGGGGDDAVSSGEALTAEDMARRSDGRFSTNFVPLVASGVPVSGYVRLTAPVGRAIPHGGIVLRLVTSLVAAEEAASKELHEEEVLLAGPGEVTSSVDVPFAFLGAANDALPESFEGRLFSVRHAVKLEVLRPWYTFPVRDETPFAVQAAQVPPALPRPAASARSGAAAGDEEDEEDEGDEDDEDEDEGGGGGGGGAGEGEAPRLVPRVPVAAALLGDGSCLQPQVVACEDLEEGASVALELRRGCFELRDSMRGRIVCSGLRTPVLLLRLALVRVEYTAGEAASTLVFENTIMDARNWRARRDAARLVEARLWQCCRQFQSAKGSSA